MRVGREPGFRTSRHRSVHGPDPRRGAGEPWKRRLGGLLVGGSLLSGLVVPWPVALAAPAPSGATVYVATSSNEITPINATTGQPGTTMTLTLPPNTFGVHSLAITPSGQTAYAGYSGMPALPPALPGNSGGVIPFALPTGTQSPAIAVGGTGSEILGMAITPNGQTAYVANAQSDTVRPITLATGTVGPAITVGTDPSAIAITPNGQTAYVANANSNTVTPIDLTTNTAETPIPVGSYPYAIAITPGGQTAYVVNYQTIVATGSVTPINLTTNTAGTPIPVGLNPDAIAITPNGQMAYVVNESSNTVSPIDLTTNTAETPIAVGLSPDAIAITPNGQTAYVANYNSSTVTPINLSTNTAEPAITVASEPVAIAITPDQAPVAQFTVTPAPAGQATTFDASASTDATSAITQYLWNFGDGTTTTTSTPTTTHTYSTPGTYTVTLTETDAAGTSTTQVFTGQTVLRNGGPSATTQETVAIAAPPTLTRLSPSSGPVGTPVTLIGSGFGTTVGAVYWTQNSTTVRSTGSALTTWTNTTVQTAVPAGLAPGTVTAAVYNATTGLVSAGQAFTVEAVPAITALAPSSGPVGTPVTLTGSAFGTTPGTVSWTQHGITVTAPSTTWGPGAIETTVPTGLTPGPATVAVANASTGLQSPPTTFTVVVPPGGGLMLTPMTQMTVQPTSQTAGAHTTWTLTWHNDNDPVAPPGSGWTLTGPPGTQWPTDPAAYTLNGQPSGVAPTVVGNAVSLADTATGVAVGGAVTLQITGVGNPPAGTYPATAVVVRPGFFLPLTPASPAQGLTFTAGP